MNRTSLVLVALCLSGCAGYAPQAELAKGKPIAMFTLECEGYVVQSGLPVPLGQRMEQLDELCPGSMTPPDRRGMPPVLRKLP